MECCETCNFWRDAGSPQDPNRCHKYAPRMGAVDAIARWPMTKMSGWCGDYEAIPEPKVMKGHTAMARGRKKNPVKVKGKAKK